MTYNKESELQKIKAKAEQESRNAEDKSLAIGVLPQSVLDTAKYIHAGIYKDVLASVSLEVPTLADAIELMETSNAIVSMVLTKGTFTSFVTSDNANQGRHQIDTITDINPWTLNVEHMRQYGTTVSLHWYAEYGQHRFRFDAKIAQSFKLPNIRVEWGGGQFGREYYIKSASVTQVPAGAKYVKYANAQPDAVGNAVVYFPRSNNTASEDFGELAEKVAILGTMKDNGIETENK